MLIMVFIFAATFFMLCLLFNYYRKLSDRNGKWKRTQPRMPDFLKREELQCTLQQQVKPNNGNGFREDSHNKRLAHSDIQHENYKMHTFLSATDNNELLKKVADAYCTSDDLEGSDKMTSVEKPAVQSCFSKLIEGPLHNVLPVKLQDIQSGFNCQGNADRPDYQRRKFYKYHEEKAIGKPCNVVSASTQSMDAEGIKCKTAATCTSQATLPNYIYDNICKTGQSSTVENILMKPSDFEINFPKIRNTEPVTFSPHVHKHAVNLSKQIPYELEASSILLHSCQGIISEPELLPPSAFEQNHQKNEPHLLTPIYFFSCEHINCNTPAEPKSGQDGYFYKPCDEASLVENRQYESGCNIDNRIYNRWLENHVDSFCQKGIHHRQTEVDLNPRANIGLPLETRVHSIDDKRSRLKYVCVNVLGYCTLFVVKNPPLTNLRK